MTVLTWSTTFAVAGANGQQQSTLHVCNFEFWCDIARIGEEEEQKGTKTKHGHWLFFLSKGSQLKLLHQKMETHKTKAPCYMQKINVKKVVSK